MSENPTNSGYFSTLAGAFITAWQFFTRIPVFGSKSGGVLAAADDDATTDTSADKGTHMIPLSQTVIAWPIVGLVIGAMAGAVLWVGATVGLHPMAASFLALAVAMLITGALHEDGLADVADGFGGGKTIKQKLSIMRDSQNGTYGVLALVVIVGFKATVLAGFTGPGFAAAALLSAHVLSRAFLPMLLLTLSPARKNGLGKGAGIPTKEHAVIAALIGLAIAVLTLGFGPGLIAAALAALAVAAMGWLAKRQINGLTGDVMGGAQQIGEALALAGAAVALRSVFYS